MWYQISQEDAYILIGAARCRMAVIDGALAGVGRGPHPSGDFRDKLIREHMAFGRLCDSLYDDGYIDCLVANPHDIRFPLVRGGGDLA